MKKLNILRNEIGGCLQCPINDKDFSFKEKLLPSLKLEEGDIDLQSWCTKISSQLWVSSCAANATADAFELCAGIDGLKQEEISRLQIYYNGRSRMSIDGVTNMSKIDKGMYIRAAFEAVRVMGVCPEYMWPYRPEKVNERPSIAATWYALKHKLHSYYKISADPGPDQLNEIRKSISGKHPIVICIPVSESFYRGTQEVIPPPSGDESIYGMHAILVVGKIGENMKIRNSWSEEWGNQGYAILHQDWFNNKWVTDPYVPTNGIIFR